MKSALSIYLFLGFGAFTLASTIVDYNDWYDDGNEIEDTDWAPQEIEGRGVNNWSLLDDDQFDYANEDERDLYTSDISRDKRCSCEGSTCACCTNAHLPGAGKIPICSNITIHKEEKNMVVSIEAKGKVLIKQTFSSLISERVCGRLPMLMFLKVCFDTNTSLLPSRSGIQACPKIQVLKGTFHTKPIYEMQFPCFHFKRSQLSSDFPNLKISEFMNGIIN